MINNTLQLLTSIVSELSGEAIETWVFGGRAEELWQLCPPRAHSDIDLLYPAPDFGQLERFITSHASVTEVETKRFTHKRAIVWNDVLVEFFLVEQVNEWYQTCFFGTTSFQWPDDTFGFDAPLCATRVRLASRRALSAYREFHPPVDAARARHRITNANCPALSHCEKNC